MIRIEGLILVCLLIICIAIFRDTDKELIDGFFVLTSNFISGYLGYLVRRLD